MNKTAEALSPLRQQVEKSAKGKNVFFAEHSEAVVRVASDQFLNEELGKKLCANSGTTHYDHSSISRLIR